MQKLLTIAHEKLAHPFWRLSTSQNRRHSQNKCDLHGAPALAHKCCCCSSKRYLTESHPLCHPMSPPSHPIEETLQTHTPRHRPPPRSVKYYRVIPSEQTISAFPCRGSWPKVRWGEKAKGPSGLLVPRSQGFQRHKPVPHLPLSRFPSRSFCREHKRNGFPRKH